MSGKQSRELTDEDVLTVLAREAKKRSEGSKVGEAAVSDVYHQLAQEHGKTKFVGYDRERASSTVLALTTAGVAVDLLAEGDVGEVVVKETPFYGESGGQVGDSGVIRMGDAVFTVDDTQKPVDGFFVHSGRMSAGVLKKGANVELEVDHETRSSTRRNHSATHLLHWALRTVVGPSAIQKGSLVSSERLRFDYSGSRPLDASELTRIEDLVNEKILLNAPVETEVLPMDQAKAKGAIGLFEEKYGDVVRMLRMTDDSIELCGGTHASRTGDIGSFKILSESGVAAGVRRVEALTGRGAREHARQSDKQLHVLANTLKTTPALLGERVEKLLASMREKDREIEELKRKMLSGGSGDTTSAAEARNGFKVLGAIVDIGDPKALREYCDQLRDKLSPAVILLGTTTKDGRALLACSVSKELTERFRAGDIVKDAATIVGGNGGGRPDFAQAGGNDPALPNAARVRQNITDINNIIGGYTQGRTLNNTVDYTANVYSTYSFREGRLKGFSVGGGANIRGRQVIGNANGQPFNYRYANAYTLVSAHTSYDLRIGKVRTRLQLNVSNLFDEVDVDYMAYSFNAAAGGDVPNTFRYQTPRKYSLTATFNF